MATVLKHRYGVAGGLRRASRNWYVQFRAPDGRRRRMPVSPRRAYAEAFARKVEDLVDAARVGAVPAPELLRWAAGLPPASRGRLVAARLLDGRLHQAARPLVEHLDDWRRALAGRKPKHVAESVAKVRRLLDGVGFARWADVTAAATADWLERYRVQAGVRARTLNGYLVAFKAFLAWGTGELGGRRFAANPLQGMAKRREDADRMPERRALPFGEFGRLVDAAARGDVFAGMTGEERALLYRVAVETAYRWSALASLTRASFRLDGDRFMVRLAAAANKSGKDMENPLRLDTSAALMAYFAAHPAGPAARAFPMPRGARGAAMVRHDLAAAGLPYVDAGGHRYDFHALRHQAATFYRLAGGDLKLSQEMMGHHDVRLTLVYTHAERQAEAAALLEKLPAFGAAPAATVGAG